ncbi:hypothetical protein [Stutzerimonas kunmingensis]|uniref:Peptidase C39 domain-containing protein n=1 Tax=Stutzerimonas kunmingensis TaxID=1211807 RepID=A0A9X1SPL2_9GAMM|nr:hypothetical protein [Stutzerimonas kunmingensis]MCD1608604.1 hypothetical protein [Stutzerimonas kunmingensis]
MIKQRKATDCGIATLANLLGTTYEDAHAMYGADRATYGVTIQETAAILFNEGYTTQYVPLTGFNKATGLAIQTISPEIITQKATKAIIQVLTPSGIIHQVFFDGKHIHDPSPKVTGPQPLSAYDCFVDALFVVKEPAWLVRKCAGEVAEVVVTGKVGSKGLKVPL